MNRIGKTVSLIAFVALLSAGPAFTQTPSDEEISKPTVAPATVAHVYVQTTRGVDVYDAASNGKLTLVKGSPFATSGQMEGINGKYLISVGTDYLHTYAIESGGAVGKQVSETNTQSYGGSECGPTTGLGSVLDHTGKNLYVQLSSQYLASDCAAWQTYEVEQDGLLTFLGDIEYQSYYGGVVPSSVPTISGNDKFGYGIFEWGDGNSPFSTFVRTSNGPLEVNDGFSVVGPVSLEGWPYSPTPLVEADPTNHLAVFMFSGVTIYGGGPDLWQLASYTIDDSTGAISSTNTWQDMPTPAVGGIGRMNMSPSGLLLAISGYPGLQFFHFNGAAPITPYSGLLLPNVLVDRLAWDNNNHLYALSYSSEKLYVYTVTPTSISEAAGSPYTVQSAYGIKGLIVVPKL